MDSINLVMQGQGDFTTQAFTIFNHQSIHCKIYSEFLRGIGKNTRTIKSINEIPYLPLEFFKTQQVYTGEVAPGIIFKSSGTTGQVPSLHYIKDTALYKQSILEGFRRVYGDPSRYRFLALTPTPEERPDSSLVYMIQVLMEAAGGSGHGFYLNRMGNLAAELALLFTINSPLKTVFLIGLSYALLDFAERYP